MKILVAGATGAVGRQLVPRLIVNGHEVIGMIRTARNGDVVRAQGATPAIADALDAEQVGKLVAETQPEVIVHELTALKGSLGLRHFDRNFAQTNRLRTEATDHLLAAGRAVGVRRFVAQSFAGWTYARSGGPIKSESDPLDPEPVAEMRSTLDAIRYLESAVLDAGWTEGIVLRYGSLYGPGTSLGPDSEHTNMIRQRKFPVIGSGGGVWSFIHVEDAAEATVAAIERGCCGIYNIVDDDPAPVSEWLPVTAQILGGKSPWRIPRWAGRLMAGEVATTMMTEIRGASNTKAKRDLDWQPRYPSWRQGFKGLAT